MLAKHNEVVTGFEESFLGINIPQNNYDRELENKVNYWKNNQNNININASNSQLWSKW